MGRGCSLSWAGLDTPGMGEIKGQEGEKKAFVRCGWVGVCKGMCKDTCVCVCVCFCGVGHVERGEKGCLVCVLCCVGLGWVGLDRIFGIHLILRTYQSVCVCVKEREGKKDKNKVEIKLGE